MRMNLRRSAGIGVLVAGLIGAAAAASISQDDRPAAKQPAYRRLLQARERLENVR